MMSQRLPFFPTCLLVLSWGIVAALGCMTGLAQSYDFEVASVKPSDPDPTAPSGRAPMILPALGRITARNMTLRMLVITAFQKQVFEVVGGPAWQNTDRFDINARSDDSTLTTDQTLARLRTLLANRFNLKVHTETREGAVYALIRARGDGRFGQKLSASRDVCADYKVQQQQQLEAIATGGAAALAQMQALPERPCAITQSRQPTGTIRVTARGQTMATLAVVVLTPLLGRPVIDKTGLTGLYDFDLTIDTQMLVQLYSDLGVTFLPRSDVPDGPSLTTVLQEDLGLKLESQRGPSEVLVVDSAEHPSQD
jgi:uncharacterized protein (TIGR03435 family)